MKICRTLRLDQIQGNITPGFRKDCQAFLFVRFPDTRSGQAWIDALYPSITSALDAASYNRLYSAIRHPPDFGTRSDGWQVPPREDRRDPTQMVRSTWLNVAFTAAGLTRLCVDPLKFGFSVQFSVGLFNRATARDAEFIFGPKDEWQVRDSSRADPPGPADDRKIAHAVLIVGADTTTDLAIAVARQYRVLALHRLDLVTDCHGRRFPDGRIHFGFRDGLSQPDPPDPLNGWPVDVRGVINEQIVPPGEFILGCPNMSGQAPYEHEWARNGSYLTFLKLEQDVRLFHQMTRTRANQLKNQGIVFMTPELLRAKAIGRWPSGAPVAKGARRDPFPHRNAPDKDTRIRTSDFTSDPKGDGCPLFAHIRKTNPRGNAVRDGIDEARKHRIIRRGIPYGPACVEGSDIARGGRGLLFLGYQADLERQFEFLAKQWMSNPDFPNRAAPAGWDPLMGIDPAHHESRKAALEVRYHREGQGEGPTDFAKTLLDRCIKAKGGGYFFAPSIPALAALANGQARP